MAGGDDTENVADIFKFELSSHPALFEPSWTAMRGKQAGIN